ncbi:hypothetical protein B0J17DRAFT_242829 [Rhizoctonia solani]|nr:hypothetical protein B0J17DRAFT_242829 [Rhizoctonia solani]
MCDRICLARTIIRSTPWSTVQSGLFRISVSTQFWSDSWRSKSREALISDPLILESRNNPLSNSQGRTRWVAPEVRQGQPPTSQSDVFSLGMTILEIITGAPPYVDKSDAEVLVISLGPGYLPPDRPVRNIPTASKLGNTLWDLLLQC